jgi:hypothetical protein
MRFAAAKRNVLACGEYDKALYQCAKPHRARCAGARNVQTAPAIWFASFGRN